MDYLSSVAIAPKLHPSRRRRGAFFFVSGGFRQNIQEITTRARYPISKEGFQALEQELDRLKKERPHVIQAIKEAREEGDLKENAGYDAARERQGMLEARIKYIESRMALFNVIDLSTLSSEKAIFGATVTVEDADTGEEREFTLLGPDEADYAKGTISIQSPVGVALLGKEVGDEITVNAPRGRINYEIIDIQFKKKTA